MRQTLMGVSLLCLPLVLCLVFWSGGKTEHLLIACLKSTISQYLSTFLFSDFFVVKLRYRGIKQQGVYVCEQKNTLVSSASCMGCLGHRKLCVGCTKEMHLYCTVITLTLTWVLNAWHHQLLCNLTSCVRAEVQMLKTNLKTEPYRLTSNMWPWCQV